MLWNKKKKDKLEFENYIRGKELNQDRKLFEAITKRLIILFILFIIAVLMMRI